MTPKCCKCNARIDQGACGTMHTIITFMDDMANKRLQRKRVYLCEQCSYDLNFKFLNHAVRFQTPKEYD